MSIGIRVEEASDTMRRIEDAFSYRWEWLRRALSYVDILRQRGDDMLAQEHAGLPPVLDFEYVEVLHAKTFPRPTNYRLLRITGRGRVSAPDCSCPGARPVMIIDPRAGAGHGPGIGGFKQESEVGIALRRGHPTYSSRSIPILSRDRRSRTSSMPFAGSWRKSRGGTPGRRRSCTETAKADGPPRCWPRRTMAWPGPRS